MSQNWVIFWIIWGPLAAIAGLVLLVRSARRLGRRPRMPRLVVVVTYVLAALTAWALITGARAAGYVFGVMLADIRNPVEKGAVIDANSAAMRKGFVWALGLGLSAIAWLLFWWRRSRAGANSPPVEPPTQC